MHCSPTSNVAQMFDPPVHSSFDLSVAVGDILLNVACGAGLKKQKTKSISSFSEENKNRCMTLDDFVVVLFSCCVCVGSGFRVYPKIFFYR